MKNIVTIGGGTGTFSVLSGLKKTNNNLTAIISVADSGGSTGKLRDEFGYLPVGDLRMALVALADDNGDNGLLRELFLYRFDKGSGLRGHNFGNIFITALSEILDSEDKAYEYASKILRVSGNVIPVTNDDIDLVAHYEDGRVIVGETYIDDPKENHDGTKKIVKLEIQPKAKINDKAKEAIKSADMIILGPGDLFTSTLASLIVDGVPEAIKQSNAKVIYVLNLINKYGQTYRYKATDYLEELNSYLGMYPDFVISNSAVFPHDILKKYELEKGYPVEDNLKSDNYKVIRADLLANQIVKRKSGDAVKRSLIRHDSDKLTETLLKII